METQGVTFVTAGSKREHLRGPATAKLFARFRGMDGFPGLLNRVETVIVPSEAHSFPLVTLIDTPGLVDGNMVYPFDVNKVLEWMAVRADLVLVFFDPLGQALCDRTMSLVSKLDAKCPDKLRYFVSKMDTVPSENDRARVLIQVTQNLTTHISPRTALRLPSIHIPLPGETRENPKFANSIWEVLDDIDTNISATVQSTIKQLKTDANALAGRLSEIRRTDMDAHAHNSAMWVKAWSASLFAASLFAAASFLVAASTGILSLALAAIYPHIPFALHGYIPRNLDVLVTQFLPAGMGMVYLVVALFASSVLVSFFGRWRYSSYRPTLPRMQVLDIVRGMEFLLEECLPLPDQLYAQFFQDSVEPGEL